MARLDYGQTCLLFAASADRVAEEEVLARVGPSDLRCDVLQVGRHGSQGAASPRFLEAVRPALAVVSWGEGGSTGGPAEMTLARLAEHGATVVRTDELESIEVSIV